MDAKVRQKPKFSSQDSSTQQGRLRALDESLNDRGVEQNNASTENIVGWKLVYSEKATTTMVVDSNNHNLQVPRRKANLSDFVWKSDVWHLRRERTKKGVRGRLKRFTLSEKSGNLPKFHKFYHGSALVNRRIAWSISSTASTYESRATCAYVIQFRIAKSTLWAKVSEKSLRRICLPVQVVFTT